MHSIERGAGVPILMLHGFGTDHRFLLGLDDVAFSARQGWWRIYADLPGMGRSPAAPSADSTDAVAREVQDFVEQHLGDQPYAVFGQSYGGAIARHLTAVHRGRVLGLGLLCPMVVADRQQRRLPPRSVLRSDPALVASLDPADAEEYAALAVIESEATWARFKHGVLPGARIADTDALARIQRHYGLSESPESTRPPYEGPVEFILGRQDHVAGYRDALDLMEHYPRAGATVIDGVGHNANLEAPERVADLVGGWLDRIRDENSGAD